MENDINKGLAPKRLMYLAVMVGVQEQRVREARDALASAEKSLRAWDKDHTSLFERMKAAGMDP